MKCANNSISTNVRFSANFNQAQEIIYKTTIRQITNCKKKKKKVKILYVQSNKDKGDGRFLVKSKKYKEKTSEQKI